MGQCFITYDAEFHKKKKTGKKWNDKLYNVKGLAMPCTIEHDGDTIEHDSDDSLKVFVTFTHIWLIITVKWDIIDIARDNVIR